MIEIGLRPTMLLEFISWFKEEKQNTEFKPLISDLALEVKKEENPVFIYPV